MNLPGGYLSARLASRTDITSDLAVFHFAFDEPTPFRPGQYATLALPDAAGRPIKRAYSIASAPHEPTMELFIELVEHGELTPKLWEMKEGDRVMVRRKIVGHFTREDRRTRHVTACTVTGIAPFLSMIRDQKYHMERGEVADVHRFLVIHGASQSHELGPYLKELRGLAEQEWVDYVPTVSRPWTDPEWTGETGRVEDVLRKYVDALGYTGAESVGYACGNPQMIENAKGILARARFDKEFVREEKYFTLKDDKPEPPVGLKVPEPRKSAPKLPPGAIMPRAVKPPAPPQA
jgi:ferredoxin/flavodoxin---NADP+ reductase